MVGIAGDAVRPARYDDTSPTRAIRGATPPDGPRMTDSLPPHAALVTTATPRQPLGMPVKRFLAEVWQRRPLLVRGAFAGLQAPLTPEDLAGLSCEELALARLVVHEPRGDRWALHQGPFAEEVFGTLPASHWTLLVQDVDKWDADVAALRARFDFLPGWRVDDVMVSYAVEGGSVGAHVDQYDVFLLQGMGRRRWAINDDPAAPKAFRDDVELRLLRAFTPTHEWVLEPGDMLYLPPGVPHHGVAEDPCLTFSIGMRAPSVGEMTADFAGFLAERLPEERRYTDPGIAPATSPGEIDDDAFARVRAALSEALAADDATLREWFGGFATRYRAAHDAVPPPRRLDAATFAQRLAAGATVIRNPWSRVAWARSGRGATLFVAGLALPASRAFAVRACTDEAFDAIAVGALAESDRARLLELVNLGHFAMTKPPRRRSAP